MLFILIVFSIPVYGYCIWSLYKPVESFFFLDRWRYKEIPELSELQIKFIKIGSIFTMILWTILIISGVIDAFTPDPPLPKIQVMGALLE
ncbi:hypothetical protein DVB69_15390 [Sporosarcina sp. BI001-red]|uniref:hypothetical protein n=1 Tax=Sporosarcina sp. BI001-red TaxID=2282866 RepID=UPI000E28004E|nr:hypothetical protein [Sporosarcina sp. BI001-red]REB05148.1 hypothetical protein DVB69_15390 [Sporosarcina sp. BI001-red]